MRIILICLGVLAFLGLASLAALYSYGHFAKRAKGEPSQALAISADQTALDRFAGQFGSQVATESGLMLVSDNLDAFAARALTARAAERSLDIVYYMWRMDLTGRLLAHEVLAAADRGVRVRLLLDDINTRDNDPIYLALDSHPNIDLRLFNPTRARGGGLQRGIEMVLRFVSVNRRMHHKAWIADGRVAIVGGRNIGDAYFDAAPTNFRDLDVVMLGTVLPETEDIFDAFWNSDAALPIAALSEEDDLTLDGLRREFSYLADNSAVTPYLDRVRERVSVSGLVDDLGRLFWSAAVEMVSDPPEKAEGKAESNWLMGEIVPVIDAVDQRLEIISPYFIPGDEGAQWLIGMVERGVDVAVLTNSLAATDVAAVHGGYAPYRMPLLEAGIRLFELQPYAGAGNISVFGSRGASLHTKAFTVDDTTGFIGSFNFDPRSMSLNTEMGVLFEQRDLVAALQDLFALETAPEASYALSLENGSLVWEGEVQGVPRRFDSEPEAGLLRRVMATVVRWLPVESQL
jgi:cardiolipin synthase C